MTKLIDALNTVKEIANAIPTAGQPIAAVAGSVVVILQTAQAVKDSQERLLKLALKCFDLAVAINVAISGEKWDHLPDNIREQVFKLETLFATVERFYSKHRDKGRLHLMWNTSSYTQKISDFSRQLDDAIVLFTTIGSLSRSAATQQILVNTSHAAKAMEETQQCVIYESQTTRTFMNAVISNQRPLDEDGLRVFGLDELTEGGDSDARIIFTVTRKNRNRPSLTAVTHLVARGAKHYVVKGYKGSETTLKQKLFDEALQLRMELNWTSVATIPKLIGTIGRKGYSPSLVLELGTGKQYLQLSEMVRNYDPYTSDSAAIVALIQFKYVLMAWDELFNRFGCDFAGADGRAISTYPYAENELAELAARDIFQDIIVKMDSSRDRFFTLVYTGELATCDTSNRQEPRCGRSTTNYLYCVCRDTSTNGSEIYGIHEALGIFVDSPVPQYPDASLKLSEIAPNLLNGGMYMRDHIVLNGFELLVGDVGYIDGATFVLLGNIRELLGPPDWAIFRVDGKDLSYAESHTFELPDYKNEVCLSWKVRYEVKDGKAICAALRCLCPTSPAFDRIFVVNGSYSSIDVHYSVTSAGEGSPVVSSPVYFHVFPGCLDDNTPSPSFSISFNAEPDPLCGHDGLVDGVQEERGTRVEWISHPYYEHLLDLTQPISIPISIPVSYLGFHSARSTKPPHRPFMESKADTADFDR